MNGEEKEEEEEKGKQRCYFVCVRVFLCVCVYDDEETFDFCTKAEAIQCSESKACISIYDSIYIICILSKFIKYNIKK